jgi:hypothetical protein
MNWGNEVVNQRRGAPADLIAQRMEKVQQFARGGLLLIMATGRLSGFAMHNSGCSFRERQHPHGGPPATKEFALLLMAQAERRHGIPCRRPPFLL